MASAIEGTAGATAAKLADQLRYQTQFLLTQGTCGRSWISSENSVLYMIHNLTIGVKKPTNPNSRIGVWDPPSRRLPEKVLGCPRNLGSMVSKWNITYFKNVVYWGEITHLLTIDPNFLGREFETPGWKGEEGEHTKMIGNHQLVIIYSSILRILGDQLAPPLGSENTSSLMTIVAPPISQGFLEYSSTTGRCVNLQVQLNIFRTKNLSLPMKV